MVVALVLLTFLICFMIDWMLRRSETRRAASPSSVPQPTPQRSLLPPIYVGGFRIQEEMAFHPGHAWAAAEAPSLVRVGVDDFAGKLIGGIDGISVPEVGESLVQGRDAWSLRRGDRLATLLSPVTGRVVEVNPLVRERPEVVRADPYGQGWLLVVRADDLKASLNNLLSGNLIQRWMEDVCARLRLNLGGGMSLSFPDGGTAVDDLSQHLDVAKWQALVREFLLTESQSPPDTSC